MPGEPPAVLSIDRWGVLSVATFDATASNNDVGISFVGSGMLVPGSPVTVASVGTTLWALMIDQAGCLSAASTELSSQATVWDGPTSIGSPVFVPGSRVCVFEPSVGALTALAVDRSGLLCACTVQPGLDGWQGPIGIGANILMPGATISVYADSLATFLAFAICRSGTLAVARLGSGGPLTWRGPDSVGNAVFVPGGHLALLENVPS